MKLNNGSQLQFRCSIVVTICHTEDPGSIPGGGMFYCRIRGVHMLLLSLCQLAAQTYAYVLDAALAKLVRHGFTAPGCERTRGRTRAVISPEVCRVKPEWEGGVSSIGPLRFYWWFIASCLSTMQLYATQMPRPGVEPGPSDL